MTKAIVLKKGRRCRSKRWKRPRQGLLPGEKARGAGQSLRKGNDKGYCLEKKQAMPVKALEKAMTRAIALKKARDAGQSLAIGNDKGYCLEKRQAIPVKALEKK